MSQEKQNEPKKLEVTKELRDYHNSEIRYVCTDENYIYSGAFDGSFKALPIESVDRKQAKVFPVHTSMLFQIQNFGDNLIICGSDGGIYIVDRKTGDKILTFEKPNNFTSIVYETFQYKDMVISISACETIYFFKAQTGKIIKKLQITQGDNIYCADIKDDIFLAGGLKGILYFIDLNTLEIKKKVDHDCSIEGLCVDNEIVYYVLSKEADNVVLLNINTYKHIKFLEGHTDKMVVVKKMMGHLFTVSQNFVIRIWDLNTHECKFIINTTMEVWSIDCTDKYLVCAMSKSLILVDISEHIIYNPRLDFYDLFENKTLTDNEIHGMAVHGSIIEIRARETFNNVKKSLESNYSKEQTLQFLEWAYGKPGNYQKILQIFQKLKIENYQDKNNFQLDLKNCYQDDDSKDFFLVVNTAYSDCEEDEDDDLEEIPIHKVILIAHCGLFRDFFENIKEETNKVTDYSGKSIESIEQFIKYLYFGEFNLTADDDPQLIIEELEDAGSYYQLNQIEKYESYIKKLKNEYNL
ncbi:division protein 1-related [Anaeramoeba flamelloides]|uniref:Division protein 1-related n=1 Tax=Anaeramoeba flamelloides TaxID=1746091 RepID=A0AAV7Z0T6_9EUKA|nr:division protein 1-related [Anaeramoeba flamelloides]